MKKTKVLTVLMLLASARVYGDANPELSLVLTYQSVDNFARTIASDRDDVGALKMIDFLKSCIDFDNVQKNQIKNAQDGYLSRGTPIDPVKIAQQNQELQNRVQALEKDIKAFKKGGVTAFEKKKIDARRAERNAKNAALKKNQADLAAQGIAQSSMDKTVQAANNLIDQNELAFEQALETYISSFGQVYLQGNKVIISSRFNQKMPITPKEFTQFVSVLQGAAQQFNPTVSINLNLANPSTATINDVISFVNNMAPAQASYLSYAGYALAATAVTAAAIGAAAIGYNAYQGKNWNDTTDAMNAYNIASSQIGQAAQTGYNKVTQNSAANLISQKWNSMWANATQTATSESNNTIIMQKITENNGLAQGAAALATIKAEELTDKAQQELNAANAANDPAAAAAAQAELAEAQATQAYYDNILEQIETNGAVNISKEECHALVIPALVITASLGTAALGTAALGTAAALGTTAARTALLGTAATGTAAGAATAGAAATGAAAAGAATAGAATAGAAAAETAALGTATGLAGKLAAAAQAATVSSRISSALSALGNSSNVGGAVANLVPATVVAGGAFAANNISRNNQNAAQGSTFAA